MDKDVDQDLVQDVYERWDSAECRRCVGGGEPPASGVS